MVQDFWNINIIEDAMADSCWVVTGMKVTKLGWHWDFDSGSLIKFMFANWCLDQICGYTWPPHSFAFTSLKSWIQVCQKIPNPYYAKKRILQHINTPFDFYPPIHKANQMPTLLATRDTARVHTVQLPSAAATAKSPLGKKLRPKTCGRCSPCNQGPSKRQ